MINIDFSNSDAVTDMASLTQWDYGRKIQITGVTLPDNVQIHFARDGEEAEIRLGSTVNNVTTVTIPDAILQKSGKFKMYVFLTNDISGYTVKYATFNVRAREKPTDVVTPDNEDIVAELLRKWDEVIDTGIASYDPDTHFTTATTYSNIISNESFDLILGKLAKWYEKISALKDMAYKTNVSKTDLNTTLITELDGKINKTDIIQNTVTNDATKVPSSVVTNSLKLSIDSLNTNLSKYICTSVIVSPTSTTSFDITNLSGLYPFNGVFAINGDTNANNAVIIGVQIINSSTLRVYFDRSVTGAIRVNIFYKST